MATYEYAVLIGRDQEGSMGGVTWYLNAVANPLGSELPEILNRLGKDGWRVVGLGDLGFRRAHRDHPDEGLLTRARLRSHHPRRSPVRTSLLNTAKEERCFRSIASWFHCWPFRC